MDSNRHCNKPLQKPTCVVLLKSVLYIRWSFLSKGFNIQIYYLGYKITHRPAAAKVKVNGNIHWYHTHLTWELYFVPSSATGMGKCLPGSAKQWPPPKVFKHIQLTQWVASQEAKEKTVPCSSGCCRLWSFLTSFRCTNSPPELCDGSNLFLIACYSVLRTITAFQLCSRSTRLTWGLYQMKAPGRGSFITKYLSSGSAFQGKSLFVFESNLHITS